MVDDPRDDEPGDGSSEDDPAGGIPDDLSGLTPEDIPDDLSDLDLPGLSPGSSDEVGERSEPFDPGPGEGPAPGYGAGAADEGPGAGDTPVEPMDGTAAGAAGLPADVPPPDGGPVDQRSGWDRFVERYIGIRVATMDRDGGPGVVLRWTARAPLVSTLVLAVLVAGVLVITFGIPPISPLFLIPVVCGPVYPWLRLESRAQATWHDLQAQ